MFFVCFEIFINIICKFMTFVKSNVLEFILCYTCQDFPNSSKGWGGGLEILLGGIFLTGSRNLREFCWGESTRGGMSKFSAGEGGILPPSRENLAFFLANDYCRTMVNCFHGMV